MTYIYMYMCVHVQCRLYSDLAWKQVYSQSQLRETMARVIQYADLERAGSCPHFLTFTHTTYTYMYVSVQYDCGFRESAEKFVHDCTGTYM